MNDNDGKFRHPHPLALDLPSGVKATLNSWQMETPDSAAFDPLMGPFDGDPTGHYPGTTPPQTVSNAALAGTKDTSFDAQEAVSSSTAEAMESLLLDIPPLGVHENNTSNTENEESSIGENKSVAGSDSAVDSINSTSASNSNTSKTKDRPPSVQASAAALKSESNGQRSSSRMQSPSRDSFLEKLKLLRQYKRDHGDCNVPQVDYPLGTWVNKQRMEKKKFDKGEKTSMSLERKDLLESVGFKWAEPKGQAAWEKRFKELVEFKRQYHTCIVPTKYTHNPALGRWVTSQRADKKSGDIDENNMQKLNEIGFVWDRFNKQKKP